MSKQDPGRAAKSRHQDQGAGPWGRALSAGRSRLSGQQREVGGSMFVEDPLPAGRFYLQPRGCFISSSSPEASQFSREGTGPKHPTRRQQNPTFHVGLGARSF